MMLKRTHSYHCEITKSLNRLKLLQRDYHKDKEEYQRRGIIHLSDEEEDAKFIWFEVKSKRNLLYIICVCMHNSCKTQEEWYTLLVFVLHSLSIPCMMINILLMWYSILYIHIFLGKDCRAEKVFFFCDDFFVTPYHPSSRSDMMSNQWKNESESNSLSRDKPRERRKKVLRVQFNCKFVSEEPCLEKMFVSLTVNCLRVSLERRCVLGWRKERERERDVPYRFWNGILGLEMVSITFGNEWLSSRDLGSWGENAFETIAKWQELRENFLHHTKQRTHRKLELKGFPLTCLILILVVEGYIKVE